MHVLVKLYGTLGRYRPPDATDIGGFGLALPDGATVRDAAALLGIPPERMRTAFVNGATVALGQLLHDSDELVFLSPAGGGHPVGQI